MSWTKTMVWVSLGLLALSSVAMPASAGGGCAVAWCIDVDNKVQVQVCTNTGVVIQVGLYNNYCTQAGAPRTK